MAVNTDTADSPTAKALTPPEGRTPPRRSSASQVPSSCFGWNTRAPGGLRREVHGFKGLRKVERLQVTSLPSPTAGQKHGHLAMSLFPRSVITNLVPEKIRRKETITVVERRGGGSLFSSLKHD